jgi:hypothetical protein
MKKILSIILVTVLAFALCVPFAVSAEPKSFNVPRAAAAPTIDGVINADEWAGALVVEMKAGDDSINVPAGDADGFKGAVFQFMWSEEGIYFSVVSTGNNEPFGVPVADNGSYNTGNGPQFNMFPTRDSAGAVGETFFFSYHPCADDGKPYVGEHFIYGTGGAGENVPEAKIAAVMNGNDYTLEGLIPAAALAKSDIPIKVESGAVLIWNNVIMFTDDGGAQGLAADAGWFSAEDCNAYTLTETLAGILPAAPEPEPVPEPEPAAPAEPAPAPAEPAPAPAPAPAPVTGDSTLIFVISAAALACAVITKKRASKA